MVSDKLLDTMSGSKMFENILSIRVLEWLIVLAACKIKVTIELDASESENSLIELYLM